MHNHGHSAFELPDFELSADRVSCLMIICYFSEPGNCPNPCPHYTQSRSFGFRIFQILYFQQIGCSFLQVCRWRSSRYSPSWCERFADVRLSPSRYVGGSGTRASVLVRYSWYLDFPKPLSQLSSTKFGLVVCASTVLGFKPMSVYSDTHVISLVCRLTETVKVEGSVVFTMFIYGWYAPHPASSCMTCPAWLVLSVHLVHPPCAWRLRTSQNDKGEVHI